MNFYDTWYKYWVKPVGGSLVKVMDKIVKLATNPIFIICYFEFILLLLLVMSMAGD